MVLLASVLVLLLLAVVFAMYMKRRGFRWRSTHAIDRVRISSILLLMVCCRAALVFVAQNGVAEKEDNDDDDEEEFTWISGTQTAYRHTPVMKRSCAPNAADYSRAHSLIWPGSGCDLEARRS